MLFWMESVEPQLRLTALTTRGSYKVMAAAMGIKICRGRFVLHRSTTCGEVSAGTRGAGSKAGTVVVSEALSAYSGGFP